MKRGIACLSLLIGLALPVQLAHAQATVTGEIVSVLDGDTVELLSNQREIRIRLADIDAPEIRHGADDPGQPYGQRSKQSLAQMVFRHNVTVEVRDTDQYGRSVGTIYDNGTNINTEQIRRGMAWVYRHYCHDPNLIGLEDQARARRIGLWNDANPVPPWDYRHRRP